MTLDAARTAQPLWAAIPAASRARYLRRAAIAMLDELGDLALRLAEETGWPRKHLVLSELLPAVRGLHALAEDGPRALADRRVSPRRARLLGRTSRLVQSPVGLIGLRGPSASPWAEPALETAAALLAGNGVILAAGAAPERLRGAFLRAGVPGELLTIAGEPGCDRVVDLPRPGRLGTLVVVEGAPREQVVEAALWAAFARHAAEAGRLVLVEGAVPGLVEALADAARSLKVGDPRDEDVDVTSAPEVVAGLSADDPLFTAPPERPTLAIVEVPDADAAVRAASDGGPVSVWARDPAKGERIARRLAAPTTWVGRHGVPATAVEVRVARHVRPRQLELRARWAPRPPAAVAAQTALAEVRHGRESRRWPALRALAAASRRNR